MNKRIIAGVLVAITMVAGSVAYVKVSDGKESNASKVTTKIEATQETKEVYELEQAYQENQEEEKYIVNLVSKATNQKLKLSDWKVCLDYLEDNYDDVMADKKVDTEKVESYVTAYRLVEADAEETAAPEDTGTPEETGVVNYNVDKVMEYIATYWETYNEEKYPNYTGMGGDCANFVSQCLHAGGQPMVGTNAKSFSNWFCRSNDKNAFSKVSSTWRGAEAFASYWKRNAIECRDFDSSYFEDKYAFEEVFRFTNPGDAMSILNSNGRPFHTVICALKNRDNDREIRFAAHTSFQCEKSIYDYIHKSSMSLRVYRLSIPTAEQEAAYNYDLYRADITSAELEIVDSLDNTEETTEDTTIENEPVQQRSFWQRLFGR